MDQLPPHLYYRRGLDENVSKVVLDHALREKTRLASRNAYPLLTLKQLSYETGTDYAYLRDAVARKIDPYASASIPKRSGKPRGISIPEPTLMEVQRWLLTNILDRLPSSSASYAYQKGRSIVQCADQHRGSLWMIKMDLHDFFGSISEQAVYKVYRRAGYSKLLSFEMTRLSTRALGASRVSTTNAIPQYSTNQQGTLPQGSPSSGQLANAAAARLDRLLQDLGLRRNIVYTRYSDDLIFSSHEDVGREQASRLVREISRLIHLAGFAPHNRKTRVIPPGSRHIVLGLLVDDTVRLPPDRRRRLELHLRGCEKFGLAEHASSRGFESVFSFVDHLDGWISFSLGVERERAIVWRARLYSILRKEGLMPD